jgi:hypothetical protein
MHTLFDGSAFSITDVCIPNCQQQTTSRQQQATPGNTTGNTAGSTTGSTVEQAAEQVAE